MISTSLELILNKAIRRANVHRHEFVTLENVLLQMLDDQVVQEALRQCQIDLKELGKELEHFLLDDNNFSVLSENEVERLGKKQFANEKMREIAKQNGIYFQPEISLSLQRVIQRSAIHIQSSGKKEIQAINLLVSIFSEQESHAAYFLQKSGANKQKLVEILAHGLDKALNAKASDEMEQDQIQTSEDHKKKRYEEALKQFTTNLTELARDSKLDPVVGRKDEIQRMIHILSRRRKNNPLLVGEAGVGKTAVAEGLANAIAEGNVADHLKETEIYSLDMASLLAGAKFRGDFEERLKLILNALADKEQSNPILFIDEIHTIVGAGATTGGSLDASNLLKPALSRGQLRCIGSTTYDEFRKHFEKDQALNRRFQKIDIREPSLSEAIDILKGLRAKYEDFHGVEYPDSVLESIIKLSDKHITAKKLPDKAIDVLDEVGARLKLENTDLGKKPLVSISDIEETIAHIARIPRKSITVEEKDKLQHLERDLKLLIYGQNHAVEQVSNAIMMNRSGLGKKEKPIASFLFLGPTGVGKTELARQLAYNLGINFQRIDMSEYMEKHSVAKLIGAPPGYVGYDEGGILTEAVNKNPYGVLLLDEIEKAHPDVFNILLQVMDNGRLTDSQGKGSDFRNIILIMTSNVGARELEAGSIGLTGGAHSKNAKGDTAIRRAFSPEFRNRLDAMISFNSLGQDQILKVVDKFLMELEEQLSEKNIQLFVSLEAKKWMGQKGFDPKLGARPMHRLIDQEIKKNLANEILFGRLSGGGKVSVELENDRLKFEFFSF